MYKTVRHGENSLQYKILAQQEEGVATLKCRKSPRTVTAKLITVIILLIVGIIASAVLVPLVLTNDFIALTGTFQKFSVSTLRRSHSGNHVVVIAKKPYGWNGLRPGVPSRPSNASRARANDFGPRDATPTAEAASAASTRATETAAAAAAPDRVAGKEPTGGPSTEATARTVSGGSGVGGRGAGEASRPIPLQGDPGRGSPKPPTTASVAQSVGGGTTQVERASSTPAPLWFEPVKKWGFASSDNFIGGVNGVVTNSASILGGFLFVFVVVVMFFILRKTLPRRRTLTEKEAAESKEDKTRLLRPSSDHDEE